MRLKKEFQHNDSAVLCDIREMIKEGASKNEMARALDNDFEGGELALVLLDIVLEEVLKNENKNKSA